MIDKHSKVDKPSIVDYVLIIFLVFVSWIGLFFIPLENWQYGGVILYAVPLFWGLLFYLFGRYKGWQKPLYSLLKYFAILFLIVVGFAVALIIFTIFATFLGLFQTSSYGGFI